MRLCNQMKLWGLHTARLLSQKPLTIGSKEYPMKFTLGFHIALVSIQALQTKDYQSARIDSLALPYCSDQRDWVQGILELGYQDSRVTNGTLSLRMIRMRTYSNVQRFK
jgi:hypothetical protein